VKRAAVVVGLVVALLLPGAAAWAADPAPYPAEGGAASAWSCEDVAADPVADPPVVAHQECVVTAWGTDPVPEPPADAVAGCGAVDDPCTVEPSSDVYQSWGFGLVLLVLFGSGVLVAQVRKS
jgi:hypothetical protein